MKSMNMLKTVIENKSIRISAALLAGGLSLSACVLADGPVSSSQSKNVIQGLENAGYTAPEFKITDVRNESWHTDIHVNIEVEGCKYPVDVPVEQIDNPNRNVWEPIQESHPWQSAPIITPAEFSSEYSC
jgi:hypothetical protein